MTALIVSVVFPRRLLKLHGFLRLSLVLISRAKNNTDGIHTDGDVRIIKAIMFWDDMMTCDAIGE